MTINERIYHLIKKNKKYSQKELAKSLNIPSNTLSQWLTLGRSIPAEHVLSICSYFDVSTEWLLTGENPKEDFFCEEKVQHKDFPFLNDQEKNLLELYRSLNNDYKEIIVNDLKKYNTWQKHEAAMEASAPSATKKEA